MAMNETLVNRVREALADQKKVEEKKMFSGLCFMVNGKMCVCVSQAEIMCRIGPDAGEAAIENEGCRQMIHNGRVMKGFVFVREDVIKSQKQLNHWIELSLAFNGKAKPAKPKARKSKLK
jgi:TfoX/Sxy family transcriptional regulator of competence genes